LKSNESPDGSLSDKSSNFDDQELSVPFLVSELGGSAKVDNSEFIFEDWSQHIDEVELDFDNP